MHRYRGPAGCYGHVGERLRRDMIHISCRVLSSEVHGRHRHGGSRGSGEACEMDHCRLHHAAVIHNPSHDGLTVIRLFTGDTGSHGLGVYYAHQTRVRLLSSLPWYVFSLSSLFSHAHMPTCSYAHMLTLGRCYDHNTLLLSLRFLFLLLTCWALTLAGITIFDPAKLTAPTSWV